MADIRRYVIDKICADIWRNVTGKPCTDIRSNVQVKQVLISGVMLQVKKC